jgi:hypothetical protein
MGISIRLYLFLVLSFLTGTTWAGAQYSAPFIPDAWTQVSYNKIPANTLKFEAGTMLVEVASSASPIVHKLSAPMKLSSVTVQARVIGLKKPESGDFEEDSILRVGLVALGSNKLTAVKKLFAADWVKRLFELAPEGSGLDKIYFLNVTQRKDLVGRKRLYPFSDLISEEMVALAENNVVSFTKTLDTPLEVAALWLSIDGDNTASDFTLVLEKLELGTK